MTQRYRQTVYADEYDKYYHMVFNYSGEAINQQVNCPMNVHIKSISDVVTPGYEKLVASGAIVNNPVNIVTEKKGAMGSYVYRAEYDLYGQPAGYYGRGGSLTWFLLQTNYVHWLTIDPKSDHLLEGAKQRALANIDKPDIEMFEDLYEIRETINLLRHPLQSVLGHTNKYIKLRRNIKARRSLTPAERVDAAVQAYLAWRFAISPLYRSIDDILNTVATKRFSNVRLRSTGKAEVDYGFKSDTEVGTFSAQRTAELKKTSRAVVIYEVSNPLNNWQQTYGLRKKDLPVGLWAVVPLSFMVDRVLNISNMIKGLTNLSDPTVSILAGSYSVKTEDSKTVTALQQNTTYGYKVTMKGDVAFHSKVDYTRSVWHPTVYDTFPVFTPKELVKDFSSIADLLSIVYSRMRTASKYKSYK